MSIVVENPQANAVMREREAMASSATPKRRSIPRGKTALDMNLQPHQVEWLAGYATDQWNSLHGALSGWRKKLKKYERIAEDNRQDRKGAPDRDETNTQKTIFDESNRSLGLVSGFADFAFAQARDDLFGTSPWFAASPQGLADEKLAVTITRHAHWKFDQTNVKEGFIDALKLATDLGTSFPKLTWRREIEKFQSIKQVVLGDDGNPSLNPDGTFVTIGDIDDPNANVNTQEMLVEDQITLFDNVECRCIDFNDVAFDPTAPELSLFYTDVFHRFKIGLLDAKSIYNLTDEQYNAALALMTGEDTGAATPRDHRDESKPVNQTHSTEPDANPPITLVEGYMRCNPFGSGGDNIRIWCVFSPVLRVIFKLDYLANQTPKGILPIYAIPWFKIPNRIVGKGYFERFEDIDNFIDEQFNLTIHRDKMAANPVGGVDLSVLDEDIEETGEIKMTPGKMWKVQPGQDISKAFTFVTVPDANQRTVELMNMATQMGQMRTGISSASQGEMSGVPESNTATGIRQIISRGAVLLKWPIDTVKDSLARPLDGAVQFLYANQDRDETFTWSEGSEPELMEISRKDVRNLTLNVTLTMTQAQNQDKLQTSQAGIGVHGQYMAIPEIEKVAARPLYLQALMALGFHGADQIIREPVTDAAGIMALLPPEMQQPFAAFAQQSGLMPAPTAPGSAPAPSPTAPPAPPPPPTA